MRNISVKIEKLIDENNQLQRNIEERFRHHSLTLSIIASINNEYKKQLEHTSKVLKNALKELRGEQPINKWAEAFDD